MKTIKELEANKEIPHREKVIINMWLNAYKEDVLELMKEFHTDNEIALMMFKELKARIEGK